MKAIKDMELHELVVVRNIAQERTDFYNRFLPDTEDDYDPYKDERNAADRMLTHLENVINDAIEKYSIEADKEFDS